ncbi:transposase [Streptomyces sp. NBC_00190]|uniref:transposase n=1 Tax=unclassified Streptomyces TaxID=2593676 RepID=UPI002E28F64A|nr:transposase [Streptomyces sp. NBC_00190]WSZ44820.1 transposase [Streptomyces sp. NBC_00868]
MARFTKSQCRPCPVRTRCTTTTDSAQTVGFPPRELRDLQLRVRAEQQTPEWQAPYAVRSGDSRKPTYSTCSQPSPQTSSASADGRRPEKHLRPGRRPPCRTSWTSTGPPGRGHGGPPETEHSGVPDGFKDRLLHTHPRPRRG